MAALDSSIVNAIKANGLLKEGHYGYRSGQHSPCLIDRDQLLTEPEFASHLGYAMAKQFFTEHINTVATPSIWGAGVAQWIAYFLEPRARIVHATPIDGQPTVAPVLEELIRDKRILLCDNLIMTGLTMSQFVPAITALGGHIVGIATVWNSGADTISGIPVFGLLNTLYDSRPPVTCELCAAGIPVVEVPYSVVRSRNTIPTQELRIAEAGVVEQLVPRGRTGARIEIHFEGGQTYSVHVDVALEYRFAIGNPVDLKTMQQAIDADDLIAAKAVAARQLAHRPRSVAELRTVLNQRGFRLVTIDGVIERFTELGYLNDAEFADRWIAHRSAVAPRGERLLRQELRQKGVQSDLVEASLDRAELDGVETARALGSRKLSKMPGLDREAQRRRMVSYLERRGFSYEIIRRVDRELFSPGTSVGELMDWDDS